MRYLTLIALIFSSNFVLAQEPSAEVLKQIIDDFPNDLSNHYGDEISASEFTYMSKVSFDDRAEEVIHARNSEKPVYSIKYEVSGNSSAKQLEMQLQRFLLKHLKGFSFKSAFKRENLATHLYTSSELGLTVELSVPRSSRGSASKVLIEVYRS